MCHARPADKPRVAAAGGQAAQLLRPVHQPNRCIMFSRLFRRGEDFRGLWAELARTIANPGDRRIAGLLIAYLGR